MLVIFDTETSGYKCGICEFGSVIITDSGKQFGFNERAKPEVPISEEAYKIHGISNEDVANCRPEKVVVLEWYQDILNLAEQENEPVVFCAHKLDFDMRMVKPFVNLQSHIRFCSLTLAKEMLPDNESHKLGTLYDQFGKGLNHKAHSAYDDCLMLAEVLPKLLGPRTYYQEAQIQLKRERPPKLLETVTYGKYKGMKYVDLPLKQLNWLVENYDDKDVVFTAQQVLNGKK